MTRLQVVEKLGDPKGFDRHGWEDFGTVQILWDDEPQKSIRGLSGRQLMDQEEVVATVGEPLQRVMDRLGLPQKLSSDKAGKRHLLNYVPNGLRVVAVGQQNGKMGEWRIERFNYGEGPAEFSEFAYNLEASP